MAIPDCEQNTMTYSIRPAAGPSSRFTRFAVSFVFAAACGVLSVPTAVADDGDRGDHGYRGDHEYGGERDDRSERGDRGDPGDRRDHWRGYERHYTRHYAVYAPPVVYYRRETSPGINIFLPFDNR